LELTQKQLIARIRAPGSGFVFTAKLFSGFTDDSKTICSSYKCTMKSF
jgi:hypothetical protein